MNYATFAALTNYTTPAAALAANPVDGTAWLLNETQVFKDSTMPKSGPAAVKKSTQTQMASTLAPTIRRNKGTSSTEGYRKSEKNTGNGAAGYGDNLNKEVVANGKTPSIRHKVAWYVTDSTQTAGYRRVFGMLEDPTTTNAYRDDDSQVRL